MTTATVPGHRGPGPWPALPSGRRTVKRGRRDADSSGVTTLQHASDWKVTAGYRVMLAFGWASLALALGVAAAALVLGIPSVWWIAGLLALAALGTTTFLPEPVPADMITGGRNRLDPR